jgi:hypothetical protein
MMTYTRLGGIVGTYVIPPPPNTYDIYGVAFTVTSSIVLPLISTIPGGFLRLSIVDEGGNASVGNIEVEPQSPDLINGLSQLVITTNYGSMTVYNNGVDKWFVL